MLIICACSSRNLFIKQIYIYIYSYTHLLYVCENKYYKVFMLWDWYWNHQLWKVHSSNSMLYTKSFLLHYFLWLLNSVLKVMKYETASVYIKSWFVPMRILGTNLNKYHNESNIVFNNHNPPQLNRYQTFSFTNKCKIYSPSFIRTSCTSSYWRPTLHIYVTGINYISKKVHTYTTQ